MNWAGVIDRNSTALKAIIDSLFVMLGLATRLSPSVHGKMMRLLRPAESAVRRLIVIAARGLVAEVAPMRATSSRVKPVGSIEVRPKATQMGYSFQLFDPRRRFAVLRRKKKVFRVTPRVHLFDYDPRVAALWPTPRPPAPPPPPVPDGLMDATRITRRLQALDLPLMTCRARPSVWSVCRRGGRPARLRYSKPPSDPAILQDFAAEGVTRSMRFSSNAITSPWMP